MDYNYLKTLPKDILIKLIVESQIETSFQKIYNNIKTIKSERVLQALERITEKPELFEEFLDAEAFFSSSHGNLDCPVDGCLECSDIGGDTVFDKQNELIDIASKLLKKSEIIKVKKIRKPEPVMIVVPPIPKIPK